MLCIYLVQHKLSQTEAQQFYMLSPSKNTFSGLRVNFQYFSRQLINFTGNFQGLFKKALNIQVLFKPVRTLLQYSPFITHLVKTQIGI